MIQYNRYIEVISLARLIAEEYGWKKGERTTDQHVFKFSISDEPIRISVFDAYKSRSLEKPSPVIFVEDETDNRWYGKISFEHMSLEQIELCIRFYIKQFCKKTAK